MFEFSKTYDFFIAYKMYFLYFSLIGIVVFIVSLASIPFIVSLIPEDFFMKKFYSKRNFKNKSVILFFIKNFFGLVFLAGGIIMLFVPGQGLLTILVALCLLSFPGKKKLMQKIIAKQGVQKTLNYFRRKNNKKDFIFPEKEEV